MDRRTRICIWIIVIGLANFLAYTLVYMYIEGEAVNGYVETAGERLHYYLQSWDGPREVSRAEFIYSGVHSISIWVTVAAIMLAMLTLAKERIASSMRSTIIRGRTFMTILATIITFTTAVITIWFILQFSHRLAAPRRPEMREPGIGIRESGKTAQLLLLSPIHGSRIPDPGLPCL